MGVLSLATEVRKEHFMIRQDQDSGTIYIKVKKASIEDCKRSNCFMTLILQVRNEQMVIFFLCSASLKSCEYTL
jgi:hypothetical protein